MLDNYYYKKFPKISLMYRKIIRYGYEPEMIFAKQYLKKNKGNSIDVGAHLGQWTSLLSRYSLKVYSFEPNPFLFDILQKTKIKNSTLFNLACFSKNSKVILKIPKKNNILRPGNGTVVNFTTYDVESFLEVKVKCTKIDSLSEIKNVSLIKIDVEGAETDVIKGSIKILKTYKPALIIEIHPSRKKDFKEIKSILKKVDYSPYYWKKYELKKLNNFEDNNSEIVIFVNKDKFDSN